ncbi:DUF4920 domain-containing protein [Flavobacterium sp.]|uniref:DUF4920 domain-containing protein n=1 Tax=Flavobacterium sp. TaxID=239 RepID=UPI0039E65FF9
MKKIIVLGCCLLALVSCKKESEEVKVDETKVDTPVDSIVQNDTVAATKAESVPAEENSVAPTTEPAKADAKGEKDAAKPELKAEAKTNTKYATFGDKITADKALTKEQMTQKYASLKKGDTINVKFKSKIMSVCKKKGCWMKMDLAENKESFIRFKDYGFFVPLNADNSDAIVSGKAFLDVISVDELKHYAKDGGKSQEEIDKITQPKITYAFQADGVLIQQ